MENVLDSCFDRKIDVQLTFPLVPFPVVGSHPPSSSVQRCAATKTDSFLRWFVVVFGCHLPLEPAEPMTMKMWHHFETFEQRRHDFLMVRHYLPGQQPL